MKRSLIALVVAIEIIVGIVLYFNFQHVVGRQPEPPPADAPADATPANPTPAQPMPVERAPRERQSGMADRLDSTAQVAQATGETENGAASGQTSSTTIGPTGRTESDTVSDTVNTDSESVDVPPVVYTLFTPLPQVAAPDEYTLSPDLIELGRMLFYEPRLSINQQMSCNTCHPLDKYGADNLPVSFGHDGTPGERNAQSVYNSALHIAQFWDGRSPTVEEQSKVPITSNAEMGMLDPTHVEAVLRSIPDYAPLFARAFPDQPEPITFDNVATAIGAFERSLITPARFDRFLAGDTSQLREQEVRGLRTFVELGCPNCHLGATVGGLLYKKLGEVVPYDTDDLGRFHVTGMEQDRYVFKVPSLRNVAHTAPYLHDGSVETLEEMVVLMARHQLGKSVTPQQVSDVVAFLHSLTGELPADRIAPPTLPPDGPNTPGPQVTD